MTLKEQYDVIIVGGGPGGCQAGKTAAELGLSALVVEKDPDIGTPVRCAEFVLEEGLLRYYEPAPSFCNNRMTDYHIVAPDGTRVEFKDKYHGQMLERKIFDRMVGEDAARAGAHVVTHTAALGARRIDDEWVAVELERFGEVRCHILVGADGTESRAGRWLGLDTAPDKKDLAPCAQYVLAGLDIVAHRIEIYVGEEIAPGGYLWSFPKGPTSANVGLGGPSDRLGERTAFDWLDLAIDRFWPDASIIGRTCGGVPSSGGLKKKVGENVMVVGDAAHQANPLTGGGIINAMDGGRIAMGVAARAIEKKDFSRDALSDYEKDWDEFLGKTHRTLHKVKERVWRLSDDSFSRVAAAANRVPPEERTVGGVIARALAGSPKMMLDLVKLLY